MAQIVDNQDEKVLETFTRMTNKGSVAEFKNAFKEKYDQDWDKIVDELKDEDSDSEIGAPEKYLEELYEYHYNKMES